MDDGSESVQRNGDGEGMLEMARVFRKKPKVSPSNIHSIEISHEYMLALFDEYGFCHLESDEVDPFIVAVYEIKNDEPSPKGYSVGHLLHFECLVCGRGLDPNNGGKERWLRNGEL